MEKTGLSGVTVTLSGVSNATATTDASGQYAFTGLRMGNYSVEISGFDSDEIGFSATASAVAVGVGESKVVSFDGTYLRTAGIQGQVSVEGEGLQGVTVSLTGGPDATDMTTTTDASGQYSFAKLRAGDYAVGISGYNTKDYEFEVTSQSVTVALGETATVPFEGTLLRTAGISGRVFVAGEGHSGVTVTLSGGDLEADMTAETDDAGVYAFSGLAAGDYTVAISGFDADAYVFDVTSQDVTVADDEAAIVNFEGSHATTASISGMLYVDEGTNNNMMDEGETPFAVAGVPVALVGPGVHDITPGATNEMGQFMFPALRAGDYQLVVQIPDAVAALMPDYAYGGPTEGYSVTLGVGEEATQNIPMDITHQTVNFSVMLRSGEDMGDALAEATVDLYADADGEFKITDGETGENGVAAIRFARSEASGAMVYASVTAPSDDYHVADDMQKVEWNPQLPQSMASNDGDIVNLKADVTFGGAFVETGHEDSGGALADWAIDVMMGEDEDSLEAVEDAPEMLDDDGMAEFTRTVTAEDLPVTYTFSVDADQDNKLDGGEAYEGTDVEYVHDGLSAAGTTDAGMIEVEFTTQTLKVYVHQERDQVFGYSGNILGGDERMTGKITAKVRYVDGTGRHRAFTTKQWDAAKRTSDKDGVVTFSNVPAGHKIVVKTEKAAEAGDIMILNDGGHTDELFAFKDWDVNGVEGGAFGDDGGFSPKVELCPLKTTAPDGQDHGECASFAYVNVWSVTGTATKQMVAKDSRDGFKDPAAEGVKGTKVTLDPVAGKNLAGEADSFTAAEKNNSKTKIDERSEFDFGKHAEGVYDVGVPAKWKADTGKQFHLTGPRVIAVTPTTGTVYGRVVDEDGFALDSATVTANGMETMTDAAGRYIIDGFGPKTHKVDGKDTPNKVLVEASKGEGAKKSLIVDFKANEPEEMKDLQMAAADKTASASGTVRASGSGDPVAGVEIKVDGEVPNNVATSGANKGKLVTGADGTYTAVFNAKDNVGELAAVSVSKAGMTFIPAMIQVPAHEGSATSGYDFTGFLHGTITGRVANPTGGPMSGVEIKATSTADTTKTYVDTTGTVGTFSVSVPFGSYDLSASAETYTFDPSSQKISITAGQKRDVGTIKATATFMARINSATLVTDTASGEIYSHKIYTGMVKVKWKAGTIPSGHVVTYQAETTFGDAGNWTALGTSVDVGKTDSTVTTTATAPTDAAFMVRVTAVSNNGTADTADDSTLISASIPVAAVDPSATNVTAKRTTLGNDSLQVTWEATTNNDSDFRVVIQVTTGPDTTNWFVHDQVHQDRDWMLEILGNYSQSWTLLDDPSTQITVEATDLLHKEIKIAVEWLQGTFDADDNPWKRSKVTTIPSG